MMHGAEKEIAGLKDELDVLIEKKNAFSKDLILAVDPNAKFSLTKHISEQDQQIAAIRARISELDNYLSTPKIGPVLLTSALPDTLPVFSKLNISSLQFDHCLRPSQTKWIISKLPDSLNLVAEMGQGRHRIMEDIETSGIATQGIKVVRVKLTVTSLEYFLQDVARQAGVDHWPGENDLFELLRMSATRHRRPILFIIEDLDKILQSPPAEDMDKAFSMVFLHQLNALKNSEFVSLIVSSYEPVNHRRFLGESSPLWLEKIELNSLSADDIASEVARCLPELPQDLRHFIAEQLEFEPNQTHEILSQLLQKLADKAKPSRDYIGQEIASLRKNLLKNGRK